jgi:tetratricopeptide (TPR) repeat protein
MKRSFQLKKTINWREKWTRKRLDVDSYLKTDEVKAHTDTSINFVFKAEIIKILFLIVVTVIVYIPAIHGGYIWDDNAYVTHNQTLRSFSGLLQIWLEPRTTPQYYPLVFSSFWLEYHLWGLNPIGYHIVNVLLHASVAVLLYLAFRYLNLYGAWIIALVFALHPVHVESVAWITERKNVLSGLFYLCSVLFFFKFFRLRSGADEEKMGSRWYYLAGIIMFVFALLSKSVTCTLPIALILVLWWKRGRISFKEFSYMIPLIVLGAPMGFLTAWLEKTHVGAEGFDWGLSLMERFLVAGRALWFYLWKLVWPVDLMFNYPHWKIDSSLLWQYAYPLSMLGLLVLLWRSRHVIGRAPLSALLFFMITLFPALGFFDVYPFRYSYVADHFQYLASIGIIALAIGGGAQLLQRIPSVRRKALIVAALFVVSLLGIKSWHQEYIYKDKWTLWTETLKLNPESALAHNNLGSILSRQGRRREAIAHYDEAMRIMPNSAITHYNIGVELAALGKIEQAMQQYREALRIDPKYSMALNNLGSLIAQYGTTFEAISYFTLAIQWSPNYVDAHYNLFLAYQRMGEIDRALHEYATIKKLAPELASRISNSPQHVP